VRTYYVECDVGGLLLGHYVFLKEGVFVPSKHMAAWRSHRVVTWRQIKG